MGSFSLPWRTRVFIILLVLVLLLLLVTGIVLLVLFSLSKREQLMIQYCDWRFIFEEPCIFTKCHSKASQCINRAPFKAQCICSAETAGNGRTVCDGIWKPFAHKGVDVFLFEECGIKYESVSPRIIGGEAAVNHSWPFAAFIRQQYKTAIAIDGHDFLVDDCSLLRNLFHLIDFSKISTAWMCGGTLINHRTVLTAVCCCLTKEEENWFGDVSL